jgi:hypothetical protein
MSPVVRGTSDDLRDRKRDIARIGASRATNRKDHDGQFDNQPSSRAAAAR